MRLALVHDWFRVNAGSEKVVGEMLSMFEGHELDVYTLFQHLNKEDEYDVLKGRNPITSLLQRIPGVAANYRYLLPLMPAVIRSFHLRNYDLILSSSHAVAKGFRKSKGTPHICYCHTPMRYAWDLYQDYADDSSALKAFLYKMVVRAIRNWDYRSAKNVDFFIANSKNVKDRIEKNYGRESVVIYPPVQVEKFRLSEESRSNTYLCMGRFVPYKKVDVVINAFRNMPDKKLMLIGDGYDAPKIAKLLQNVPNVTWLGYKSETELIRLMQKAKACIFAAREDFGIMCVEAQACGTPVIALRDGGYLETVVEGKTGYLFDHQTEESIMDAVRMFEDAPLTAHKSISQHAQQFSATRFRKEMSDYINTCLPAHTTGGKQLHAIL